MSTIRYIISALVLISVFGSLLEARTMRRPQHHDDFNMEMGESRRGSTGERAIMTIRGVRQPYDGSAPRKIIVAEESHRGDYPRDRHDKLNSVHGGGRLPYNSRGDYENSNYGRYEDSYMERSPRRAVVTGIYPISSGGRLEAGF